MPSFGWRFNDAQVASVLTFVRNAWAMPRPRSRRLGLVWSERAWRAPTIELRAANRSRDPMSDECNHEKTICDVTPSARGCEECLKSGSKWLHLRLCRACGHVGCCDDSPIDTLPSISTRPATPSLKATIRRKAGAGVMSMRYSSICPAAPRLRLVQFHAIIDAGRTNDESRGSTNDACHI